MQEQQPIPSMQIPEAKSVLNHTSLNLAANQVADYAEQRLKMAKRPNLTELHRLERNEETLSPEEQEQLGIERDRQAIRSQVVRAKKPIVELLRLKAFTPLYGVTRIVAEAIARGTGGRVSSDTIQQAREIKRQTTRQEWDSAT